MGLNKVRQLYSNWFQETLGAYFLDDKEIPTKRFLSEFGNMFSIPDLIEFRDSSSGYYNSGGFSVEFKQAVVDYIEKRKKEELINLWIE